ncbi:SMC-Scp complex subunit ScpB [Cerasicoccus fimbriatus]|uniref:SMC-Scp complex subunit ScpB n=1 Tax=Cerasicoccus fimbriatus TaxID=3014554 RepID=UPI0022B37BF0|nr:SMC-Scp complex subunit ScpB [Cerasicoccus sp. TK19100]
MVFNLKKILRALLLSTSEPLSIRDIQAVITRYHQQASDDPEEQPPSPPPGSRPPFEPEQSELNDIMEQVPTLLTATQIRDAMDAISAELIEKREVYRVIQGPAGYRITTSPEFADWVRLLRNEARPMRLSQAAMETMAIVAYRQPVTRAELEAIRGVSADGAINRLLEHELVVVTGRADLPGRPIQYGTTDKFLEFIGIQSIEELPASDVLSPNQITEWIRQATQGDQEITDQDVGLPAEDSQPELPVDDGSFDAEPDPAPIADEANVDVENEEDESEADKHAEGNQSL